MGFEWDAGNAPKLAARHSVLPGECEQVFLREPFLVSADDRHYAVEVRWRALSATSGGRLLHVVFTMRRNLVRVVHVRDMNRKERAAYVKAQAQSEAHPNV